MATQRATCEPLSGRACQGSDPRPHLRIRFPWICTRSVDIRQYIMHRPKTCPANSTRCAAMSWNGNLSESSDANLAVFLPPRSYSNKMYSKIIAYATTWTAASVQDLLSIGSRIIDATAKCMPNHKRVWGQMHKHFQVLALLRWISRLGGVIYLSSHGHGETSLANQVWRVFVNLSSAMCSKTFLGMTWLAMYPRGILSHFCCDTITASMSCRHQNCLGARMCKRRLCARQARSDRAMLASSRSAESQNQNTLPFFQS